MDTWISAFPLDNPVQFILGYHFYSVFFYSVLLNRFSYRYITLRSLIQHVHEMAKWKGHQNENSNCNALNTSNSQRHHLEFYIGLNKKNKFSLYYSNFFILLTWPGLISWLCTVRRTLYMHCIIELLSEYCSLCSFTICM